MRTLAQLCAYFRIHTKLNRTCMRTQPLSNGIHVHVLEYYEHTKGNGKMHQNEEGSYFTASEARRSTGADRGAAWTSGGYHTQLVSNL